MKKYDVRSCTILRNEKLTQDVYDVTVEAGRLADIAQPGQFAQIAVPGKTLRRPISICEIDRERHTFRFVFQVRGEGTAILAGFEPSAALDILAPLGNGYDLGDTNRRVLFVGGGIGLPPLLGAAQPFGKNAVLAAGFRTKNAVILKKDFEAAGCRVLLATDDGSLGHRGNAAELLQGLKFDEIFACGPLPMLRAVCRIAEERGVPCQVSLEERMACGIGACLGCAVKLRGPGGEEHYGHVCKDGPVFRSTELFLT